MYTNGEKQPLYDGLTGYKINDSVEEEAPVSTCNEVVGKDVIDYKLKEKMAYRV